MTLWIAAAVAGAVLFGLGVIAGIWIGYEIAGSPVVDHLPDDLE